MSTIIKNVKKLLLYAGLEKNEYEDIRVKYQDENRAMRSGMCLCCGLICFLFGAGAFWTGQGRRVLLYYLLAGVSGLIISALMSGKQNDRVQCGLTRVYVWLLYALGIYVGTIGASNELSVLFMVLIFVLPFLFNDRPIMLLVEMAVTIPIFVVCAFRYETQSVAYMDTANAVVFAIAGIVLNCFQHKTKAKGYLAEINKQKIDLKLKETDEIIANANMGVWTITLFDGEPGRLTANETMRKLLSLPEDMTDETEIYNAWYSRIKPEALPSVLASVETMKSGKRDENTYLWIDPVRGQQYVRCGGVAQYIENKGYILRGYHYNVNEEVLRDQRRELELKNTFEVVQAQFAILKSMTRIYSAMHLIDLETDSEHRFSESSNINDIASRSTSAAEMMRIVIDAMVLEDYREDMRRFIELTTLRERMGTRKIISREYIGSDMEWYRAQFVQIESDDSGMAQKVMFTTQCIEAEKRQRDALTRLSYTDELTGFGNRRAYEQRIAKYRKEPLEDGFAYISIDVNGLKTVNDTLGHAAGDELLVGACRCIRRALGDVGALYRIGGDEFVCLALADEARLKSAMASLEKVTGAWHGELVKELSVSCGVVARRELPGASIDEIALIADQRLYSAKRAYYISGESVRKLKTESSKTQYAVLQQEQEHHMMRPLDRKIEFSDNLRGGRS